MLRKLVFFVCLLICFFLEAQEPVSIHLTQKDGLPDKEFYNILEDKKGFIWLCADKGLFRFNGKTYKNYSNKEKRGLSVFNVLEDKKGTIWCNNISGQFFYVDKNDTLKTFVDLRTVLKGELAFFTVDNTHLTVFTQNNIYFVNKHTKIIDKKLYSSSAFSIPTKIKDETYITTLDSVGVITKKHSLKQLFPVGFPYKDKNKTSLIGGRTNNFKLKSTLFLRQVRYSKNTFFKVDVGNKKVTQLNPLKSIENQRIYSILENNHQIWIATSNGVHIYNWQNNQFAEERHFLKGKNVTKIIKDKDDNYWFITLNNGIYIMPNIFIETFNISEANKNISSLDKINNQTLYFGSKNGNVGFYNTKTNTETTVLVPNNSRVSALKYNPKKNESYIGKDVGEFVLDHNTLQIKKSTSGSSIKNYLILDNNNIHVINYRSSYLQKIGVFSKRSLTVNRRPYTSYYNKKNKAVFVAYVDGLVKFNTLWKPKKINYNNQPIYGLSITETNNNILWVGTFKDGVYGIKNDKVVHHFSTKNGLVSNRIEKIKGDGINLWIATDAGIQKLNTKTNTFKTLNKSDGVVSYDISGIEILEDKVVFSSNDGLFSIDKQKAFKQQKTVEAYFTKIEVNEENLKLATNYTLDYNQNAIKFSFNVNGLAFNKKGNYKYRLAGFNNNWVTTTLGEFSVKYNSLPAGDYVFEVQPILNETKNKTISLRFSIKKPFWKTWWFFFAVFFLTLGIIIFYFRRKIKKEALQRKLEVKQLSLDNQLIALKLENLRSQMNPHFIFNALNSIQEYIILNQKKLASEYLGKFADLIRTYLNHSTKGKITLQEEIDCLEMYLELEKLRFEDKLNYTINTFGNLKPTDLNIPTMLIQPYVENALKHGLLHKKNNRNLSINFKINEKEKLVNCTIIDNGIGRSEVEKLKLKSNKKHTSFATKATEDRLNLLNYGKQKAIGVTILDLFKEEKPAGTKVEISIPFTTH